MSVRSSERRISSYMRGGALDVAGAAGQRHDVADIDAGVRAQGDFTSHSRQSSKKHASCGIADAIGHVLDRAAVELAIVNEDVDHIAGKSLQDLVGVDFGANNRLCSDNRRRATRDDDVVARFKHCVAMRLDIGALAHDPLDHAAAADLVFDGADGPTGCGRHSIGAGLEFAIVQIFSLWRVAARKLRLELCSFRFQIDPHQFRRDKRHVQERKYIAEHVGDGVAGGNIGVLLLQHLFGQSELG